MAHGRADASAAERGRLRAAWLLFAPPCTVAALLWVLTTLAEKDPASLQLLSAAPPPSGGAASLMLQASLPFVLAVLMLALLALVAWWSWRRFGGARVLRVAAVLWVLLWAGAATAVAYRYLDRAGRQALPALTATVLQASEQPPTTRGVGGARALLRVPGFDVPQRVLLEEANAARLGTGTPVTLSLARGRFGSLYVTGWQIGPQVGSP